MVRHETINTAICWPTQEQALLLRACLLSRDEALQAWQQWKRVFEKGQLDKGSRRLLPLLYRNLQNQLIHEPVFNKLKEEYFHAWSQNQFSFRRVAPLIREFARSGIQSMILKGSALTILYYEDAGLRPMADIDLLVRRGQARQAISLLNDLGWESKYSSPEAFIPFEQAIEFIDASNQRLDLHWHLLWEARQDLSDEAFWSGSIATEIDGTPTRALNPTDQLLHVCVHGAKWNDTPSLRWVADAMMIIRSRKFKIDWTRLVRQAQVRQLTLPMRDTLGYLADVMDAAIPPKVLTELREMPVTKLERTFYRIRLTPNDALKTVPVLWHWINSLRLDCEGPLLHRLSLFSKYLQSLWSVKHLWQVPFYLVAKPLKRVTAHLKSVST